MWGLSLSCPLSFSKSLPLGSPSGKTILELEKNRAAMESLEAQEAIDAMKVREDKHSPSTVTAYFAIWSSFEFLCNSEEFH